MNSDSSPAPDSPANQESTPKQPDDPFDQPALTRSEALEIIARLKKERRMPTFERLQKSMTQAASSVDVKESPSPSGEQKSPLT